MSFILDALKKAESERNRQLGPVLMDARVAPPRRALPAWGWVLAIVVAVNLAVLGWLLLRSPAPAPAMEPDAAAAPAPGLAPVAADSAIQAAAPAPAGAGTGIAPAQPVAPAAPPIRASSPSLSSDVEALPSAQDLQAQGVVLPELQVNLHVYDPLPAHRSVLLNGQRLREGEFTPQGVRVERITEQFVVLEAAGRRFRISAGG